MRKLVNGNGKLVSEADKKTNKQTNKKPGMRWSNCMSKRQGRNSWLIDERD